MQRRIMGLETEYGLSCVRADGSRAMEAEEAARLMFKPIVAWARSANVFLANASRVYLDVGSHPEYASAECDDPMQVLAQDRAGDEIMASLVWQANSELDGAKIHLLKNNVDSAGNSFGSHENYLVDRRGEFSRLPSLLLPFLITRQIVTGAGGVIDGKFVFSRRSDHLWEAVSSATTRTRPIINTRDEPHADESLYRRLHVISGDSSIADTSAWLKFAMTSAVLSLIESGRTMRTLSFREPIATLRAVARDLSAQQPIELSDGGTVTALDVQQIYLDEVAKNGGDERMLNTWQRALDAVRSGDHTRVETELDWAIKEKLFREVAARRGVSYDHPDIARLDLAYHDVVQGIAPALERRGALRRLLTAQQVQHAVDNAPATTRAHLRGRFITAAQQAGVDYQADWKSLRINRAGARAVMLPDPFANEAAAVDNLITQLTDEPERLMP
ncbi:Pup--protein ligase [Dermabacteraceae bacterium P13103]